MKFEVAKREQVKLCMLVSGPPGSGKSYSSMGIMEGICGHKPWGVVCTEDGKARLYADSDPFDFWIGIVDPPYTEKKLQDAVKSAKEAGFYGVIIDSLTHFWKEEGGVIDVVDEKTKSSRSKNSHASWKDGKKIWKRIMKALSSSGIHVICTARSKVAYEQYKDPDTGKMKVAKLPLSPELEGASTYEFDVHLAMDADNCAVVDKSRCNLISGKVFDKPGSELGQLLVGWADNGESAKDKLLSQIDELETCLTGCSEESERTEFRLKQISDLKDAIKKKGGKLHSLGATCDTGPILQTWSEKELKVWLKWLQKIEKERE